MNKTIGTTNNLTCALTIKVQQNLSNMFCPVLSLKSKNIGRPQVLLWKSLRGLSIPPTTLDYFKRGILYGICGPNTCSEDLLPDTQSVPSSASAASLDLPSSLASEASQQQNMALGWKKILLWSFIQTMGGSYLSGLYRKAAQG
jgi:hypothetical protein